MKTLKIKTYYTVQEIQDEYDDIGLYLAIQNNIPLTESFQVNFTTKECKFSAIFMPMHGTTQ